MGYHGCASPHPVYTVESSVPDQVTPKEIAYYFPKPMWRHGDWVKSLIVFFDGVRFSF
jgi:hypothetical protein